MQRGWQARQKNFEQFGHCAQQSLQRQCSRSHRYSGCARAEQCSHKGDSSVRSTEFQCRMCGRSSRLRIRRIDISRTGLELAQQEALRRGLEGWPRFERMDAERLAFATGSFDRVCGSGIRHHLDLPRAVAELARVSA